MDVSKVIAAAPFVRKAWKWAPVPLRVPLVVVGVGIIAWRWFTDREHPSAQQHEADVAGDTTN